jgi:hypothetical protein
MVMVEENGGMITGERRGMMGEGWKTVEGDVDGGSGYNKEKVRGWQGQT